MARIARVKVEGGGAFYHVCARIAGHKGEYPLDSKLCRRTIIDFIFDEHHIHWALTGRQTIYGTTGGKACEESAAC